MGNEHGTFGECAEQFRNDYLHNSGRPDENRNDDDKAATEKIQGADAQRG